MSDIPQQVMQYLGASAPFDVFDDDTLHGIAERVQVVYVTEHNCEATLMQMMPSLFLIQSGQFTIHDENGNERFLSEGDYFGYIKLLDKQVGNITIDVDSPGIVYAISERSFLDCCENRAFLSFFKAAKDDVLQNQAVSESNTMWLYRPLCEILERSPIAIEQDVSIQKAAEVMSENSVSSIIITEQDHLIGIVTDRDLRNRVVATGLDIHMPVHTIMTEKPAYILHNQNMFSAIALMSEKNIHHLPILHSDDRKPMGMVTTSDVVRQQRGNVVFMIGEIAKAENLYQLTRLAWQMPQYFAANAKRAGDFDIAGKVLSQATDIMTRKLIEFFIDQHGEPPLDYCWVVYGSQARQDQTMGSDQDNALLLAEDPNEAQAEYFAKMSEYVCKSLGKCGIKLCPGNIMAANPNLRLSVGAALKQARGWVRQFTPEAILEFNIFLDARAVAGERMLFKTLQQERKKSFQESMFLAAVARTANSQAVPLSIFNKFVFQKHNGKKDCINIKYNGVALINDLARLYALSAGITIPGTVDRLNILGEIGTINKKDADNLRDIWLFLNRLRWRHQLRNNATDNIISISDLSSIEKHQLKAAFKSIQRAQDVAVNRFSGGLS